MPYKADFNKKEKEEIRLQAIAFWTQSTKMMEPYFDIVNDCERLWRAQLPQELEDEYRKHKSRASLAPPDIYINIKSLRSELSSILFSRKPFADLSIDGQPNIKDERITKAEWVLQSQLDQQSDNRGFESEADKAIHQALYAGRTAVFTHWVEKMRRKPLRGPAGNLLLDENGRVQFQVVPSSSYAETKSIDIRRCRIDPAAETGGEMRICGFQALQNLSELKIKNRDPNSFYDFDEKELENTSFQRDLYYQYVNGEVNHHTDKGKDNDMFGDRIVEKWEIRGLFRFEKSDGTLDFRDLVVVIANRETLIAVKQNDLPLHGWELFDFPAVDQELSRFFTMGMVEPMMDTWVEQFLKRNQSLDRANRTTYDSYIADKNATHDLPDILEYAPGIIHKVDLMGSGVDDVRKAMAPLPRQSGADESFIQAAALKTELQQGMSLSDYLQGLNPQRKETATAVSELTAGSKKGLLQIAKHLKDTYLAPAWRKQLILYNYFKGHQKNIIYDIKGQQYDVSPGELDMLFRVDVDIQANANEATMVRRWVETYPLNKQDPNYDQYELSRTHLEVLDIPNRDRIMKPDKYLADIIERENIALASGVALFVSPFDNDQAHIKSHVDAIKKMQQQGIDTRVASQHVEAHQEQAQEKNKGLGNTKEFGANKGDLINPTAGAAKVKSQVGV